MENYSKKIKELADALRADARRKPADKRRPKDIANKRKPIEQIESGTDFSGERSPYWEFLYDHQVDATKVASGGMSIVEDVLGNPDSLSEYDTLYSRPLSEDGEIRLQATQDVWPELSSQQKKILHLCGQLGYTMESAAKEMMITLSSVQVLLNRARVKIQRRYDSLKTIERHER